VLNEFSIRKMQDLLTDWDLVKLTDPWETWTKGSFGLEGPEDDRWERTDRDPWTESRMWPARNSVNDGFIEQKAGSSRVAYWDVHS